MPLTRASVVSVGLLRVIGAFLPASEGGRGRDGWLREQAELAEAVEHVPVPP